MAVTYKASGTFTAGTASITPPYPTGGNAPVAGDIALLVITSENEAISLTTANGFVELGDQNNKKAGTAATDPGTRLAVYWKRCVGSDSAPVVADSGNNTEGQIHLFSGCKKNGNPWNVFAEGNDSAANDTSGSIPGATTTVANTLVVLLCSTSFNGTSTVQFGSWTNANLANLTERADNSDTAGLGGGHGMATGDWASTGAYGASTVTLSNTSFKGTMSIALAPEVSPTVTLSSPSDGGTVSDNTPDLVFVGTDINADDIEYQVQIDTVNSFDSVASGFSLKTVDLKLTKVGSPTDNLTLEVRSGSFSGSTLGTSNAVAASGVLAGGGVVTFTFASAVVLSASTQYFLVLSRSGARDAVNYVAWMYSSSGDVYSGGAAAHQSSGVWFDDTTRDGYLVVYDSGGVAMVSQTSGNTSAATYAALGTGGGSEVIGQSFTVAVTAPLISAVSSTDAGFANTTTPADTHPFNSGDTITYTVQTTLADGTYYWRVRGIDPSGSNTYGSYATTRSFIVSTVQPGALGGSLMGICPHI